MPLAFLLAFRCVFLVLVLVSCPLHLCSTPGPFRHLVCCFFSPVLSTYARPSHQSSAPVLCGIRSAWCRRANCFQLLTLTMLPLMFLCFCFCVLFLPDTAAAAIGFSLFAVSAVYFSCFCSCLLSSPPRNNALDPLPSGVFFLVLILVSCPLPLCLSHGPFRHLVFCFILPVVSTSARVLAPLLLCCAASGLHGAGGNTDCFRY